MPVNILVADDSVTMRRIMEVTFAGEEAQVVTVASGDEAVAKAEEWHPDVVFADLSMPGTDGYALASAVKGTPGLEQTAVIALASQKTPYDESRGRAAGIDDHVIKPFDTQHVIEKVQQLLSQPRQRSPAVAAPQAARPAPPAPPPRAPRPPPAAPAPPPKTSPGMAAPAAPAPATSARAAATAPSMPTVASMGTPAAVKPPPAPPTSGATSAAATEATKDLGQKLDGLGLDADQVAGVLAISREVIERVVWEVVPDLAETIIKEEIRRLTQ